MKASDNKQLYSKWSKYYHEMAIKRNHFGNHRQLLLKLFELINVNKKSRILDAACGTGDVGANLFKDGYRNFHLNDISLEMTSHLDNCDIDGLKISNYSWEDLNLFFKRNEAFDLVYILGHSLPHAPFENMSQIFNNIFNGLKSGSHFIFDMRTWVKDKNSNLIQENRLPNEYRSLGNYSFNNEELEIFDRVSYDGRSQIVEYKIIKNTQDADYESFFVNYSIFTENEIIELLERVGFTLINNLSKNTNSFDFWSYSIISCYKE